MYYSFNFSVIWELFQSKYKKKKKKEQDEACKQPVASRIQGIFHPVWPPPSHAAPIQDKMETEYQGGGGRGEEQKHEVEKQKKPAKPIRQPRLPARSRAELGVRQRLTSQLEP